MRSTLDLSNTGSRRLQDVVSRGQMALLANLQAQGKTLPRFVTQRIESFIVCGDPRHGFSWLRCARCDHHRLVPFSCKVRDLCPACGGRRMCELAGRWTMELLPRVAVRQWVVTAPWPRRWLLARRPALARGVLRVAIGEIRRWLRTDGVRNCDPVTQMGSITGFYTVAAEERFVLEQRDKMVLLSGFSGHGFKFGALMGHLAAAVATKNADPESMRSLAAGEISDLEEIERLTGPCLA